MTRSAIAMREKLLKLDQFKNNPDFTSAIRNATDEAILENPVAMDSKGFHIALIILGITIVVSAIGVIFLKYHQVPDIPEYIGALATTAIGAVAGLVVSPTVKS